MRHLLLASVFALPLALPAAARAQTVSYPAGIPSGGAVLQNATGAALAGRMVSFGTGFASGAVPAGSGLAGSVGGAAVTVQMDVHSTWADGSARWASVTLPQPALAAGGTAPVTLAKAAAPAPGTLAWPNPTLVVAGLPGGSSVALTGVLTGSTDTWLSGPLAVQRRADVPVPGDATGTLHLVADVTCFADGSVTADVQFRRDVATVQPATGSAGTAPTRLAGVTYTPTVTLNGAASTLPGVTQFQYQDWHVVLGDAGVNVQHDVAALEAAGLVPPFDLAIGVTSNSGDLYPQEVANLATAGFGAPLTPAGITTGMNTTGGRPDIGVTTGVAALWLMTQDNTARRYALAQADAAAGIPWHEWNAGAGRWWDTQDAPALWTDGRAGPGTYNQYLSNPVPVSPDVPWDIATSHMPNASYVPALLTGSRFHRDMQAAQATGALNLDYPPNREGSNDVVLGGLEARAIAWLLREAEEAAALGTPGATATQHLQTVLADSWAWYNTAAQEPTWKAAQGTIGVYVPDRNGPGTMAPWQQDYFISAIAMGARLGDTGAKAALADMTAWRIQALLAHAGWNRRNGVTYHWESGSPALSNVPAQGSDTPGAQISTWSDLQNSIVRDGNDNAAGSGGSDIWLHSEDDQGSLARESLIWFLSVYPGNANATAALGYILGSGAPYTGTATYQATQQMEALAVPAGVSAAAVTQEPGGFGNTGSTVDPGYYAASAGGTSSSGTSTTATGAGGTAASPVAGAVAEYTFASLSGGLVADVSGGGHPGTLTGKATLATDANGSYLATAGGGDYLELGSAAALTPAAFSLSALVDMSAVNGVHAFYGSYAGTGGIEFRVSGGTLQLLKEGQAQLCAGSSTVPINTLVQVGVTYDGATCSFYQAGAAAGATPVAATFSATDETVGTAINGSEGMGAAGRIYRLGVWNRVLTASEMASDAGIAASGSTTGGSTTGTSTGSTTTSAAEPVSTILSTIVSGVSAAGAASANGLALPNPGEPMAIGIGGLHVLTVNGSVAAGASGAITVTAATLPTTCTPPTAYYAVGARTAGQAAGGGQGAPGYCNDAHQVVLTATGLPPTF